MDNMISSQGWVHVLDCLFTDEARFNLTGYINGPYSRIWSAENPHVLHDNARPWSKSVVSAQCLENDFFF